MKVTIDDQLFDTIPGLCVGVVALRAADNRGLNMEAEAFRRRCCTETNLLLKMNPAMADAEVKRYQDAMDHVGQGGHMTALEATFKEYKKDLGISEKEEAAASTDLEILSMPKKANLDELAGSDVLPRTNPIMDMLKSGMLKFHVDIHGYDMGDRQTPLAIVKTGDTIQVTLGDQVCTSHWLSEKGTAGQITEKSEDVLILITGFAPNRKKVTAARNELARRMKSAFDRAVEVGWMEANTHEFTTDI